MLESQFCVPVECLERTLSRIRRRVLMTGAVGVSRRPSSSHALPWDLSLYKHCWLCGRSNNDVGSAWAVLRCDREDNWLFTEAGFFFFCSPMLMQMSQHTALKVRVILGPIQMRTGQYTLRQMSKPIFFSFFLCVCVTEVCVLRCGSWISYVEQMKKSVECWVCCRQTFQKLQVTHTHTCSCLCKKKENTLSTSQLSTHANGWTRKKKNQISCCSVN